MAFKEHLGSLLHSIRLRLTLWFTAILAVILFAFSTFLFINQSRSLQDEAVHEVIRRVTGLVEICQSALRQGAGEVTVPNGLMRDSDIFFLLAPDGQVLAGKSSMPVEQAIQIASAGLQNASQLNQTTTIFWTSPASQNYVFITTPLGAMMSMKFMIIFGAVLDPNALVRRFLLTLVFGNLITLAIALVGGFWLADRAMRPVKTITQAARSIGETDLSRRLNLRAKDELGELANTFDAMIARLQSAFERQRQFVADASHELRTPLTIVNLETSRAIASRRSSKEYQQALSIIHSENDYMTSLVNDLLTLARMDAGQSVLEISPLDLSDLAVETLERLSPLAARNGVRLEAGSLPETRVAGDRQHLLQMLTNLVENAIKYSNGENKRVSVETGANDGSAWVRVSDNGLGIAPEHIPHLFDRFYRVDKARTREDGSDPEIGSPGGSGLGLSIVQWIARAHGGEISVESVPGQGTTFEVRFKAI
jgi:heavy metal sensor kinase